jgi:predicted RNA-binding Zn-ribbon protein involved in translation (DUF1610 family)
VKPEKGAGNVERDHNFHCPACDEQGVITLPDEFTTFNCPAECGARFVKYKGMVGWSIRCVVRPVFARDDEQGDR